MASDPLPVSPESCVCGMFVERGIVAVNNTLLIIDEFAGLEKGGVTDPALYSGRARVRPKSV